MREMKIINCSFFVGLACFFIFESDLPRGGSWQPRRAPVNKLAAARCAVEVGYLHVFVHSDGKGDGREFYQFRDGCDKDHDIHERQALWIPAAAVDEPLHVAAVGVAVLDGGEEQLGAEIGILVILIYRHQRYFGRLCRGEMLYRFQHEGAHGCKVVVPVDRTVFKRFGKDIRREHHVFFSRLRQRSQSFAKSVDGAAM